MAQKVIFTLPADVVGEATSGLLLGEFNNWNYTDGIDLKKQKDGSMSATASLEAGKTYQYRYLLNDGRWVNDQRGDQYVHISGFQIENCVVKVEEPVKVEKIVPKVEKVTEKELVLVAPKKVVAKKGVAKKVEEPKVSPQKEVPKKPAAAIGKAISPVTAASKAKAAKGKK